MATWQRCDAPVANPAPLISTPCTHMNPLEHELATLIVGELNLEDVSLDDVNAETPLYGEGFGLDSIDILEIALLISKKYGFELRSDNPDNEKIFATLGALAAYVEAHRTR
jgi:acyl carrier protein